MLTTFQVPWVRQQPKRGVNRSPIHALLPRTASVPITSASPASCGTTDRPCCCQDSLGRVVKRVSLQKLPHVDETMSQEAIGFNLLEDKLPEIFKLESGTLCI